MRDFPVYCGRCQHRIVMPAFSTGTCANCGKELVCPNTPPDRLCFDCAKQLGLCQACGGPLDAKPIQRKPFTCNGCKALNLSGGTYSCSLGYDQTAEGTPLEVCPKPRTNMQLCEAPRKPYPVPQKEEKRDEQNLCREP